MSEQNAWASPDQWAPPGGPAGEVGGAPARVARDGDTRSSGPPAAGPARSVGWLPGSSAGSSAGSSGGLSAGSSGSSGAPRTTDAAMAAETVTIPLRPLELAEILDSAIANIRRNPKVVLGFSLIVTCVVQVAVTSGEFLLLDGGRRSSWSSVDAVTTRISVSTVNLTLTVLIVLVLTGLFAPVMGRTLVGRSTRPGLAWADVRPRAPQIVAAAVLPALIAVGIVVVALLPAVALAALGAPVPTWTLTGLAGAGIGAVAAIWVYINLAFAAPVVALERRGVLAALRRSAELVRRRRWRTLGALALAGLLTFLIGTGIQLPFDLVAAMVLASGIPDPSTADLSVATVAEMIGRVVSGTLTNPFNAGVAMLLYADHRIRREGFDLELRTRTATEQPNGDLSPDGLGMLWRPSDLTGHLSPASAGAEPSVGRAGAPPGDTVPPEESPAASPAGPPAAPPATPQVPKGDREAPRGRFRSTPSHTPPYGGTAPRP